MVLIHCYDKNLIKLPRKLTVKNKSTQWIPGQFTNTCSAYINDDSLVQQALFLGSHDKVMRVVPVVHNVLQIDTCNK